MFDLLHRVFSVLEQWLTGQSTSVQVTELSEPCVSATKNAEYDDYVRSNVRPK
jgi:hypothetical protein